MSLQINWLEKMIKRAYWYNHHNILIVLVWVDGDWELWFAVNKINIEGVLDT